MKILSKTSSDAGGRDDAELVQEAVGGDREAYAELVRRYQRRVRAVVTGMVRDPEVALDLTQEAFLKAWRSLPRFNAESSFYTWLYRIAVNLTIDYKRHERRQPLLETSIGDAAESTSLLERVADESPAADPEQAVQGEELRERMRDAIGDLTPDHKAVILLREVEGLSYEEIGLVMQCSKGTVMSRLHYARKKLQACLGDCV